MAKAKRVFQLAKELGVASKAVVTKCQAEGVPDIDNHMSVVKLGLEMTIRDWFSTGEDAEDSTAVETAEKVDLEKARKARRKRASRAKAKSAETDGDGDGTATAVEDPPEEEVEAKPRRRTAARRTTKKTDDAASTTGKAKRKAKKKPEPEAEEEAPAKKAPTRRRKAAAKATPEEAPAEVIEAAPVVEAPEAPPAEPTEVETPVEEKLQPAAEAPAIEEEAKPVGPLGTPNVPIRPDVVKPAGERLTKKKVVSLKGPQVVRIEKPDQLAAPRPRRQQQDQDGVADGTVPGIARSRGPVRGKGAGGGPVGREGEGDKPRNKRRSLSSRRGRSADSETLGRTKFTEADLAEMQRRTERPGGFIKRRKQDLSKKGGGQAAQAPVVTGGKVEIAEPIFIKDLSSVTGIKSADVIKYLFTQKGIMATINSAIGAEAAMEVALEYNIELEVKEQETAAEQIEKEFAEREQVDVRARPPVVTVMGHVDHGKTSLLDRIRAADVAAHEAGGITQHTSAYRVTVEGHDGKEKTVVFLDTPGHSAFTSMRARGANVTDLVVLVVAADDGVMPQTIESINHAKAAEVPIIVALNKIDTPQATEDNIRKIYGQLAEHGLNPVEWGGETEVVKTSATEGIGVTELVEILDYQAELLELKADYGGPARGIVIEGEMQEGRGPVARVLVQDGRLAVGNFIVSGRGFGRVRDMTDDHGRRVQEAGPATPLEISGLDNVPDAGDHFYITNTLQRAEDVSTHFREIEREQLLAAKTKVTLENFADAVRAGKTRELPVVLKADVQGSIETIRKTLGELGNDEVRVRVLHSAVGGITESDIELADASNGVIVGFHVVATTAVREIAEARSVEIRLYRVIYELLDEIKKALEGMLEPDTREEELGKLEVIEPFRIGGLGVIAGGMVAEGVIQAGARCRVIRDGIVVTDDREIANVRRIKNDVKEVRAGTECGVRLAGFDDIKQGDEIVCYKVVKVARTLD